MRGAASETLVVRPRKLRGVAWLTATFFVVLMVVVAVLLRSVPTGVYFRAADQIAMVVLGLLLAAGVLLFARPRVRADADGVEVRNLLTTRHFSWDDVVAVSFPDGAAWARLDLPADEYVSVMAIQAVDGPRAVAAIRALRAMHAEHAAGAPRSTG